MVVVQGRISVTTGDQTMTAGQGELIHMPKGGHVVIRSREQGAVTAYVTYPHWAAQEG